MSANVTTNAEQQQLLQTVGEIRKSYEAMLVEYSEILRDYVESDENAGHSVHWQPSTQALSRIQTRWGEVDEQSSRIEVFLENMKKALLQQQKETLLVNNA